MIVVWSPIRGWLDYPVTKDWLAAVDAYVPAPFTHYIGNDYSPEGDAEKYEPFLGPIYRDGEQIGERRMYHCKSIGGKEAPNMGRSLRHMFILIRRNLHNTKGCEGLLTLFCNVVIRENTISAFRQAHKIYGKHTGAVAPILTTYAPRARGEIWGFGGCRDRGFMGLKMGAKIGSWDSKWPNGKPKIDVLPWAHLSCLWIPRSTIMDKRIDPDAERFNLYWVDHDICKQIQSCGLKVIVTSNAVVSRDYNAKATKKFFPTTKAKVAYHDKTYEIFKRKWGI